MIATEINNNTLVHRVARTIFRLYSSGTTYICLLRATVIKSETRQANQNQKRMCIDRQLDILNDHIVNMLGYDRR